MMTVGELIQKLLQQDRELVVYVCIQHRPYQPVVDVQVDADGDGAVSLIMVEENE
ncbi:MAG: hypothetical protein QUS11_06650 [Candidatus Fermentibacter sp.]|nr:hypothetical protein [Candidatus Fermentibacter sp.]